MLSFYYRRMKLIYIMLLTAVACGTDAESPCVFLLTALRNLLTSDFAVSLYEEYKESECLRTQFPADYCRKITANQYKYDYLAQVKTLLDPTLLCCNLGLCGKVRITDDPDPPYVKRVRLGVKPNSKSSFAGTNERLRFVVFGDLHVDFGYREVISREQ